MAYIGKSPDGTGVRSRFYYTQSSGGGTSVTGSSDDGTSLAFSDGAYVDVFLNGVLLVAGTDYNTSTANTIAGLAALASGDVVEVVVYDIFTVADTVSSLNGGTFSGNVVFNGTTTGLDLNGTELVLDADADTSITADTDDQIDFKVGGTDRVAIDGDSITYKFSGADDANSLILEGSNGSSEKYTFQLQADGGGSAAKFMIGSGGGAASEKMRIDSSGNVGIGTTVTGDAELIVYGDDAATIYKNSTTGTGGADGFYVGLGKSGGTAAYVYQRENTNLIFGTNDTERMRISQSGDLILGTTATIGPAQFNVDGGSQCAIGIRAGNGTSGYFNQVLFANNENSALIGSIQRVNNASVQYNTTSDARLKENIADMTGAITRVKQLAPKRYSWVNEDLDVADQDGFLAHEAQTVVPGAVSGTQDEVDGDGNPIYMQMDYSKLVPLLTGALKEAITKIEALEARVTALEDA